VLISKLVITCVVGGSFGGYTGVLYFPLLRKSARNSYLAIAKLTDYQHRMLLLLRIPHNIQRTYIPIEEVSAGLARNWSESDSFYITFT
jgi:hypothetical protein